MPSRRPALLVFAKRPEPGQVKTRLTPLLSEEAAAELYEAFLRDALAQYAEIEADVRLYLAPPHTTLPEGWVPPGVTRHEQRGDDLGSRMARAFLETFASGYERVVIIGTDHPTLPTPFVEAAFETLEEPLSIAIGPSADGGYYLLGMNEFYPQLFQEIVYSRPDVFERTVARAAETEAALTILPPWYDVDTPDTLYRLVAELGEEAEVAPRTRTVLGSWPSELLGRLRGSHE